MRTFKTLIILTLLGAVFVWGGDVALWMENAYWAMKSNSAKPEQVIFLGDWLGTTGTTISIKHGGKADFRNDSFYVRDANLKIESNQLRIEIPGFEKTMTVEQSPRLGQDGLWRMRLDGEVFLKQSHDQLVGKEVESVTDKGLVLKNPVSDCHDFILFAQQFTKVISE